MPLLLQDQEGGHAHLVLAQVLHTLLRVAGSVHHDEVEGPDGRGDGDVVLLVNGAQVTCRQCMKGKSFVRLQLAPTSPEGT